MRVRITGTTVLNYEELEVVAVQGQLAAVASLVLFTVAVSFGLRSLRLLFALVASLIASLVWTNAFAAAAIGHLNQVSVAFNVLIIGLGGELGIHFCLRYEELAAERRSRAEVARRWPAPRSAARCSRARSPPRSASWCSCRPTTAASPSWVCSPERAC